MTVSIIYKLKYFFNRNLTNLIQSSHKIIPKTTNNKKIILQLKQDIFVL
jgi:hypothetical protein